MENWRYYLSLALGKTGSKVLRFIKSGGTAAPGLYAQRIYPGILEKLAKQLDFSIIVSGTNGKTTTARILAQILKADRRLFFHNRTGSNLERGILSELLKHSSFFGLADRRIGLWETDEAVFSLAVKSLKPKIVLLNNLFRDQLDRYGELDTVAKKWLQALKELPKEATCILNSDDPTVALLGKNLRCQVVYFGLRDQKVGKSTLSHASDATICPNCLSGLNYELNYLSHLGVYSCPKCGSIQPAPDFTANQVIILKDGVELSLKSRGKALNLKISLPGLYNAYNLLASYALAKSLKIADEVIKKGVLDFRPAFGRHEELNLGSKTLRLLLVKNPTGFNEALDTLPFLMNKPSAGLLVLNDKIADGKDISWIWDVDLEEIRKLGNLRKLIVSGRRAEDLMLRLKYANLKQKIIIQPDLGRALSLLLCEPAEKLFILPTYTAMLEIRKLLHQKKLVHSTWED